MEIDYNYALSEAAPIAQLDRALVFGTSGWEFESLWAHSLLPSLEQPALFCCKFSLTVHTQDIALVDLCLKP